MGEHETFRCLSCDKTFVSKPAIGRHFDRAPSHGEVTITAADIETEGDRSDGEAVSRGVARRQLLDRLTRDEGWRLFSDAVSHTPIRARPPRDGATIGRVSPVYAIAPVHSRSALARPAVALTTVPPSR